MKAILETHDEMIELELAFPGRLSDPDTLAGYHVSYDPAGKKTAQLFVDGEAVQMMGREYSVRIVEA